MGAMELERFFGPEARAKVEEAVRAAEQKSTGQIVPVVVERSAQRPEVAWMAAFIAAAVATLAASAAGWPWGIRMLFVLQMGAGLAGALLSRLPVLERLLAGSQALEAAARDRARIAFHEHGLDRTEKGTGVLVFASLFERRAVVLGDHGIDARMGEAEWRRAVDALTAGMRRGDPAAGFCEAIALCGAKLAEHFPRSAGGPNELPDRLQTDLN